MSVPPLWIDHGSIRVSDLASARATLERLFGLSPTPSPHAPDRHSRLFFDRSYLEVSVGETPAGPGGTALYFFRFTSEPQLRAHLDASSVAYHSEPYRSADGVWENLEVRGVAGIPAPIFVRRTEPPQIAADWPPRHGAWPCGATSLRGFALEVTSVIDAEAFFLRLLGPARERSVLPEGGLWLRWAQGASLTLARSAHPGIAGVLLETGDLGATEQFLQRRGAQTERRAEILWASAPELPALRLGFVGPV